MAKRIRSFRRLIIIGAVSTVLIFAVLAYIMSKRLSSLADGMVVETARILAHVNQRVLEKELDRSMIFGQSLMDKAIGIGGLNFFDLEEEAWFYRGLKESHLTRVFHVDAQQNTSLVYGESATCEDVLDDFIQDIFEIQENNISEPYKSHVDSTYKFSISYISPDKDRALVLEIDLTSLWSQFLNVESFGYGYVSVVSPGGHYIVHPDVDFVGKSAVQHDGYDVLQLTRNDKEEKVAEVLSEYLAISVFRVYSPLRFNWVNSSAVLMVSVPINELSDRSERIESSAIILGGTATLVIVFILIFTLGTYLIELTRRLKAEDINEKLKQMQNKLVLSEKMASLGELTAGIAHEINNPLNFISANVNPLSRDISFLKKKLEEAGHSDKEEIDEVLEEIDDLITGIEEGAERTSSIVNSLQSFSRKDTGEKRPVLLSSLFKSSLRMMRHRWKDKVEIQIDLDEQIEVLGEEGKLQQVVINLIANSIQAMDRKLLSTSFQPQIKISAQVKDKEVRIEFEDNGVGMAPQERKKVFDPFFTTKEVGEGLGLGLSISYGIIKSHKGRIEIESQKQEYCRFNIYLPLA